MVWERVDANLGTKALFILHDGPEYKLMYEIPASGRVCLRSWSTDEAKITLQVKNEGGVAFWLGE